MKKFLLTLVTVVYTCFGMAQTATNFTVNDCSGNSIDLFTELNAGKVVVLCWVMPCGACIGPAMTSYNVVQSYQSSNPNKVYLYLVDDYANTNCTALNTWGNTNSIPQSASSLRFSSSSIDMMDYGSTGMPKIVVVGGTNHTVFYNVNNTVNATALQNAIDDALSAAGVIDIKNTDGQLTVSPNPSSDKSVIKFSQAKSSEITLQLFDLQGKLVKNIYSGKVAAGENTIDINTSKLNAGMYLVKFSDGDKNSFINLVVSH